MVHWILNWFSRIIYILFFTIGCIVTFELFRILKIGVSRRKMNQVFGKC